MPDRISSAALPPPPGCSALCPPRVRGWPVTQTQILKEVCFWFMDDKDAWCRWMTRCPQGCSSASRCCTGCKDQFLFQEVPEAWQPARLHLLPTRGSAAKNRLLVGNLVPASSPAFIPCRYLYSFRAPGKAHHFPPYFAYSFPLRAAATAHFQPQLSGASSCSPISLPWLHVVQPPAGRLSPAGRALLCLAVRAFHTQRAFHVCTHCLVPAAVGALAMPQALPPACGQWRLWRQLRRIHQCRR